MARCSRISEQGTEADIGEMFLTTDALQRADDIFD
jgi:hypothetical protein